MYSNIYIESDVRNDQRVSDILGRFPDANTVILERYTELFNRKAQDFRLQKKHPSLILARKHDRHVLPAPAGYGIGGIHNYYFSTMLNCLYDCRYCFLQGMYRSANHVVFVNYHEFAAAIHNVVSGYGKNETVWFFSGYDCDSLALEPVVGMARYFMDSIEGKPNVRLELRTKSTQIRSLLEREPMDNVIVAFSLTPARISNELELKVPDFEKRLTAMRRLQESGWQIGLRLDPLIYTPDYQHQYQALLERLFSVLNADEIHSVSIGVFRLPKGFYKSLERLYPDDSFIAQPFVSNSGQVSYPLELEFEMKDWCFRQVNRYIKRRKIFFAEIQAPEMN